MHHYSSSDASVHAIRRTKSGTRWPHKSVIADGDFVSSLNALGYFRSAAAAVSHVVVRPTDDSLTTEPLKAGKISLPPVNLPCTHPDVPKSPLRAWRDAGEEIRGLFFHKALEREPNVKAFTLMLSRPVEALARSQGKHCLAWLHRRVVRQLRPLGVSYKGGAVPFWFAIEESDQGRLHIHAEISVGDIGGGARSVRAVRGVLAPLRNALKAAGGEWDEDRDGAGRQLRFEKGAPDFRWAGYCLKSAHKARPVRRRYMRRFGSPKRWVAGFEGKSVTASEGVAFQARRLFDLR